MGRICCQPGGGRVADHEGRPGSQNPDSNGTSKSADATTIAALLKKTYSRIGPLVAVLAGVDVFTSIYAKTRSERIFFAVAAVGGLLLAGTGTTVLYFYGAKLSKIRIRASIGTLAAAIMIVMAASTGVGYLVWHGQSSAAVILAVRGYITSPRDGTDNIPRLSYLHASGTVSNVHEGHRLWLFLYVASVNKYYASDPGSVTLAGTQWAGTIYVGGSGQPGENFTLWLVDFGPKSLRALHSDTVEQESGFSGLRLGSDTTILDSRNFTVI
jgi:hypothetical protein